MDEQALGAWRALLNAHASTTAVVERELAAAGLPPLGWYDVLWPLHRADRRRLRMGELAEQVTLSRTGLTRLVDRIERQGLLRREPAPDDRRGITVALTPAGAAALRRMWPVYERALDEWFAPAVGDPKALRRTLEKVAARANLGYKG